MREAMFATVNGTGKADIHYAGENKRHSKEKRQSARLTSLPLPPN